eukprot:623553-Amphidinium_carterae.1
MKQVEEDLLPNRLVDYIYSLSVALSVTPQECHCCLGAQPRESRSTLRTPKLLHSSFCALQWPLNALSQAAGELVDFTSFYTSCPVVGSESEATLTKE